MGTDTNRQLVLKQIKLSVKESFKPRLKPNIFDELYNSVEITYLCSLVSMLIPFAHRILEYSKS